MYPVASLWDTFTKWSGWAWNGWVALGSTGTLLAVIVALAIAIWGAKLANIFAPKPKLKVSIAMRPPDVIQIRTITGVQSGAESYYYRLRVKNDGNREAQDVEVRLLKLRKTPNGGAGELDQNFLPLNLTWANTDALPAADQVTMKRIQPKLDKQCNLLRIMRVDDANPMIEFLTEVTPNEIRPGEYFTKKRIGNYLLDIAIAANNAKVIYKTLRIEFAGWYSDLSEMVRTGLVVKIDS